MGTNAGYSAGQKISAKIYQWRHWVSKKGENPKKWGKRVVWTDFSSRSRRIGELQVFKVDASPCAAYCSKKIARKSQSMRPSGVKKGKKSQKKWEKMVFEVEAGGWDSCKLSSQMRLNAGYINKKKISTNMHS